MIAPDIGLEISPTMLPRQPSFTNLSAITAGFGGSSSGIPASTLPQVSTLRRQFLYNTATYPAK